MRVLFLLVVWSLAVTGALAAAPIRNREPETPKFEGESLPVPPLQAKPWAIEAKEVPKKWVSAAREIFAQGCADPRGGEYREIEVVVGNVWAGGQVLQTRGWVLPRQPKWTQDFAVCWNGLVYPVVKTGAPANFRDDALGMKEDVGADHFLERSECSTVRGAMVVNSGDNKAPLKVCLLLRLGEPALAIEAMRAQARAAQARWGRARGLAAKAEGAEPAVPEEVKIDLDFDPYLDWARQWAWALWDRAVCAHMRRDDRLCLASLQQLKAMLVLIDHEAQVRGFPAPRTEPDDQAVQSSRYLPWLNGPFPQLLADQQRRAKTPRRPTVVEAGLDKYPEPAARIAALIEDLREVAVRQWGQPGGLGPFEFDPIVAALIESGEPAIEPLLTAWEKDGERLTRSVSFGRDFAPRRYLHRVAGPIAASLAAIMEVSMDDFRALPGGVTPQSVREYWRMARGTTPAERWFRTLADDNAGAKAWQQAASEIVRPENQRNLGGGSYYTPRPTGEVIKFAGEVLRAKKDPSVAELWQRRAMQILLESYHSSTKFALNDACRFIVQLAKWDEGAALPSARAAMGMCFKVTKDWPTYSTEAWRSLPKFAALLNKHGDAAALDEYCAWLGEGRSENVGQMFHPNRWRGHGGGINIQLFAPLWANPETASVKAAMHKIFAGENPPIAPVLAERVRRDSPLLELIRTPLMRFAEVRPYVLAALEDQEEWGEVKVDAEGWRRSGSGSYKGAPPSAGTILNTVVKYRVRDFYAWQLSRWNGMPEMEVAWPLDRRDAACAEAMRVLREGKGLFQEEKPQKLPMDSSFPADE